jgi:GNAT superfamily N-acetyltransferase
VRSVIEIRRLPASEVGVIAGIDRSEHVDVQYEVRGRRIVERPVLMADIPDWDRVGDGEHSLAHHLRACAEHLTAGGILLAAITGEGETAGAAIVDPVFQPPMAWLAWLHVSRPYRRRGVAHALWTEATALARAAGAASMYISATPTGSAVGFYVAHGAVLADPVHPVLFEQEPDDIHLISSVS